MSISRQQGRRNVAGSPRCGLAGVELGWRQAGCRPKKWDEHCHCGGKRPWGPRERGGRRSAGPATRRSEEHTSELQSLMRTPYAVFCLKKKKQTVRRLGASKHT